MKHMDGQGYRHPRAAVVMVVVGRSRVVVKAFMAVVGVVVVAVRRGWVFPRQVGLLLISLPLSSWSMRMKEGVRSVTVTGR